MGLSQNINFLFIFYFAKSETKSIISRSLKIWNFIFQKLKTMSIEIMHVDFQTHGTNILGVLQKIAGSLFFFDHPVVEPITDFLSQILGCIVSKKK